MRNLFIYPLTLCEAPLSSLGRQVGNYPGRKQKKYDRKSGNYSSGEPSIIGLGAALLHIQEFGFGQVFFLDNIKHWRHGIVRLPLF